MSVAVIEAMWRQTEPHVFITREQFEQGLAGWTIEPVERDGELLGAFVTRGPELHFSTFKRVPFSLQLIRNHVDPILKKYGYIETRTPKTEIRQQRFNERLGFVREGEDEFFVHYKMSKPRWHLASSGSKMES
jgi:hypothetical protein